MQLFICHTPLHILISLLVAKEISPQQELTFAIIEDSRDLHALAKTLIKAPNFRLLFLPGAANANNLIKRTLLHRSNANLLRRAYAKRVTVAFIFHDLRAESQSLLNSANHAGVDIKFILLEDGIAVYEPHGFLIGGFIAILKRKIAFGMNWRHARELGLHPEISEIHCFYPQLLRANLRNQTIKSLPTSLPDFIDKEISKKVPLPNKPFVIIAVPHTLSAERSYILDFISSSLEYCKKKQALPLFKVHPSDTQCMETLKIFGGNLDVLPQGLPLELILLCEPHALAFIGSRTSALHVAKAMCPGITCTYFERDDTEEGRKWIDFLDKIGIPPLSQVM